MHLGYTDADVGTVVCHPLQAGSHIRKDKSHFNGTFSCAKSLDMTVFQLLAQLIDHFFQRFDLTGQLYILIFVNLIGDIHDILHRMFHDTKFLQSFFGELQSFFMKLLGRFHNIHAVIGNSLKITDTVKHNGNAVAVMHRKIFLVQFYKIGSKLILVTVHLFFRFFNCLLSVCTEMLQEIQSCKQGSVGILCHFFCGISALLNCK